MEGRKCPCFDMGKEENMQQIEVLGTVVFRNRGESKYRYS